MKSKRNFDKFSNKEFAVIYVLHKLTLKKRKIKYGDCERKFKFSTNVPITQNYHKLLNLCLTQSFTLPSKDLILQSTLAYKSHRFSRQSRDADQSTTLNRSVKVHLLFVLMMRAQLFRGDLPSPTIG